MTESPTVPAVGRSRRHWLFVVATVAGAFLGAVLLFAAFTKVLDPGLFAEEIRAKGLAFLLPAIAVAVLAIALEVGLGVALLLGLRRTWLLLLATALVVFFLFLTGRDYVQELQEGRPLSASCGCFGNFVERTPAEAFWQDVAMLVPSLVLAWFARAPGWGWPLPRGRGLAVLGATVVALALSIASPVLPFDGLATKLAVGQRVEDLCAGKDKGKVCLRDVLPILDPKTVVVVSSLDDPVLRSAVADLNRYALDSPGPKIWVLVGTGTEEIDAYRLTTGATFPLKDAPGSLLRRLYRRLPRSFLLVDGAVETIWDGLPPLDALEASAPR